MAKKYTITHDKSTGWWAWHCKDGSASGYAPSHADAKKEAKAACTSRIASDKDTFDIIPPLVNAVMYRGYLSHFTAENLDGKSITFSVEEIRQSECLWFFGLPCAAYEHISPARKAITILKIWGIYRGGNNVDTIKKLHYLSDDGFIKLINRQYIGLQIIIEDDGRIIWKFSH